MWRRPLHHGDTEASIMGLGVGIFLLAVGAVLAFAVNVNPTGGGY
jgi:hypothetical protein